MREQKGLVRAVEGDLTRQVVDAIVNAANETLAHGGGVAAAIVRAGGQIIQDESDQWVLRHGQLEPGIGAVTTAGDIPAKWVVHVAGPRFRAGQDNEDLLRTAVQTALSVAVEAGATSVALPAISAGIFGYPVIEATKVIVDSSLEWTAANPSSLGEVRLVGYDQRTTAAFQRALS